MVVPAIPEANIVVGSEEVFIEYQFSKLYDICHEVQVLKLISFKISLMALLIPFSALLKALDVTNPNWRPLKWIKLRL
jgi:hypothetical protein